MTAWLQQKGLFDDPNQQITSFLNRLVALKRYFDQTSTSPWLVALLAGTLGFYIGFFAKAWLASMRRGEKFSANGAIDEAHNGLDGAIARVSLPSAQSRSPEAHELINVTPAYLIGLCKGLTGAQAAKLVEAYKGRWLTVTMRIGDVHIESSLEYALLQGTAESGASVAAKFPLANAGKVEVLPRGHEVTIQGRITRIEPWGIALDSCELLSDRTVPPEPVAESASV